MAHNKTSLEKIFFISQLFMVFPLQKDKRGFYRCHRLAALCLTNIFLMIYAIVHLSTTTTVPMPNNAVSSPLFNSARWMKALQTVVYILCPLFNVNRLNDIQKTLTSIDDSLCDYVTNLESPKVWLYAAVYFVFDLILLIAGLCISQDRFFLILMFWVVLTNHILECQFLGLIDLFEMRYTSLLQLVQTLSRRKHPPLMRSIKLSRIHRSLSECLLSANEFFSLQLLIHTTTCFVFLAVESYYMILLSCKKIVFQTIIQYIEQIILVVTGFSNFYLIANKAQTITIKVRSILFMIMAYVQK